MNNPNKNKILTIIIIAATFLLAGVAVFTAVRLYQLRNQAVAPNQPISNPEAAALPTDAPIGICTTSFMVPGTPTPSPSPTPTRSPSPTPTLTPSPTPTRSPSPTPSRSPSPTPTRSPSPTPTRSPSPTPTRSPSPTPVPQCNSVCTTTAQCPSGMTCSTGVCRNTLCTTQANCLCPTATPSPTPVITASPSPTPTVSPGPTAICSGIKAYDSAWSELSSAQLSDLKSGDNLNFCVVGSTSSSTFDMAKFTINGVIQPETATKRPTTNDFCQEYVIPANTYSFNITAQIHHVILGWIGP